MRQEILQGRLDIFVSVDAPTAIADSFGKLGKIGILQIGTGSLRTAASQAIFARTSTTEEHL
jgi:hypothetical protein